MGNERTPADGGRERWFQFILWVLPTRSSLSNPVGRPTSRSLSLPFSSSYACERALPSTNAPLSSLSFFHLDPPRGFLLFSPCFFQGHFSPPPSFLSSYNFLPSFFPSLSSRLSLFQARDLFSVGVVRRDTGNACTRRVVVKSIGSMR